MMKLRKGGHDARDDFETLTNELRAAALDMYNRGHTNVTTDQVP